MYKDSDSTNGYVNWWQLKGFSDGKLNRIGSQTELNHPELEYGNSRIKVKFDGSILKEPGFTNFGSVVNIYIVYRLIPGTSTSNIVLRNCLFGSIDIIKTADSDKYAFSGRIGIGFD